ncbi:hypothetical protein [Exiguobacterium sp. s168]|uniref:hypothetical protein n=1 Tax=Exiguobacterium sp. s168 TaxID=2751194 RepID=UPI001BECF414|nr:hypothetical protein [Exiguobacterium sp. s168]
MLDLFIEHYRNKVTKFVEENDITFPLAHEDKFTQRVFKYLIYISLPFISLSAIAYNFATEYLKDTTYFFMTFIILSVIHIVVSLYLIIRIRKLTKKFGIDKKEKKKIIQLEMVRLLSKDFIIDKLDQHNEQIVYIKFDNPKEFDELKKGFERRLSKHKKDLSFNYSLMSIVVSFFIAFSNSLGGNNGDDTKSLILLIMIPFVASLGIAIHNFYKNHYVKNYMPIEEELEDIIDLLQEVIILKTISENSDYVLKTS